MKKILILLLLSSICHASGPKYNFSDPKMNDELSNVYRDIGNVFKNGTHQSTITLTSVSVSSITVNHIYGPFTNWVSYTPTITGAGTVTNNTFFWRRVGDTLFVQGSFLTGTVAASQGQVSLPSGLSIDFTKIPSNSTMYSGWWTNGNGTLTSGNLGVVFNDGVNTNQMFVSHSGTNGAGYPKENGSGIWTSSCYISVVFDIPISGWSF